MDRPSELPAPAAPTPAPAPVPRAAPWTVCLLGYAVALAVTGGVLYYGMQLEDVDLSVPFTYEQDALLILPLVKVTVETGTHWTNDRLGAPGIQELYDYPIVDSLHLGLIWLLGRFVRDPITVFNLYYLLTYPLTTLTAMFVLRRFRLSIPASAAMAVLYAFQPYHYARGEVHYFLSAYFVVPLTLWVALRLCQGSIPFFGPREGGGYRFRPLQGAGWGTVLAAVLTATAGAYYAFFGCALLAAAAVYGWRVTRTWRAPLVGFAVVALIGGVGLANHAKTVKYQAEYGVNEAPHLRTSEESELYGLKLAQLLLPVSGHNWQRLAAIRAEYDSSRLRPSQTENESDTIGIVGSLGLIGLLIAVFLPGPHRWPVGPLASLALFAVLLGTIGAVGSLIAHLITPQVRAYNRVCIYIAFLALMAAGAAVDWVTSSRWRVVGLLRLAVFGLLVWIGLWDQLNNTWFRDDSTRLKDRAKTAEKYREDHEFFARVEELFPDGGAIFNYPHVPYPESHAIRDIASYDNIRGYLHTSRLKWSFGSMKGREWDLRLRSIADDATQMLERLIVVGFRALLVDKRGIELSWFATLDGIIRNAIGEGNTITSPDQTLVLYDLREHAKYIERTNGPARFAAMAAAERDAISVLWLRGFASYEPIGKEGHRYHARPQATMVFVNPTERTRAVRIRMEFATLHKEPTTLTIRGDVWSDTLEDLREKPRPYERVLVLPPGRHSVAFDCPAPPAFFPSDSRWLFLIVTNFVLEEVPVPKE